MLGRRLRLIVTVCAQETGLVGCARLQATDEVYRSQPITVCLVCESILKLRPGEFRMLRTGVLLLPT